MKVLFINVSKEDFWTEDIEERGILDLGIELHLNRYKSYKKDVYDKDNVIIIGTSNLKYPGSYRAMTVFRSPLHGGIHSSSLGGFGEFIRRAGYRAIVIEGKASKEKFVIIKDSEVYFIEESLALDIKQKEEQLREKLKNYYKDLPFRILLVGVASKNTSFGSLVSEIDIAGRGGAGSVLVRAHSIVGLSIGGSGNIEYEFPKANILEATKKYREKGTFCGNYTAYGDKLPMYNYSNILQKIDLSDRISKLLDGYSPQTLTCGERCPAACKKIAKGVKIDYEPAHAVGPFIGIFDREKILQYLPLADKFGMDTIYLGHILAGLLEYEGELDTSKETNIDISNIIRDIAFGNFKVERARNFYARDHIFYTPFGDSFDMTPNFYYSLGVFLPIPIPGTYLTDYKRDATYDTILQRAIKEYQLNNLSLCRFHRKWLEPILDYTGVEEKLRLLYEYRKLANANPVFWESEKTITVIKTFGDPESIWQGWLDFLEKKLNIRF